MKQAISTLLFGLSFVAAVAVETKVQEHMKTERLAAARQAAVSGASAMREAEIRDGKLVMPARQ